MKIGWFTTGRDEEAKKLLEVALRNIRNRVLDIDIQFVFMNREKGESIESDRFIEYAQKESLRVINLSSKNFKPDLREKDLLKWRDEYHDAVWSLISPYSVELSLLAGYMLIVGKALIKRHTMLNLHPAIPGGPKGTWQDVIWSHIKNNDDYAGAQIHIVTEILDEGPPITFCKFNIKSEGYMPLWARYRKDREIYTHDEIKKISGEDYPLFRMIRHDEFRREIPLIIKTLILLSQRRIIIKDGIPYDKEGDQIKGGIDISDEIDNSI